MEHNLLCQHDAADANLGTLETAGRLSKRVYCGLLLGNAVNPVWVRIFYPNTSVRPQDLIFSGPN
jgi:hypothetical protein